MVSTSQALSAALATAAPGDEIVLRDGAHRGDFTLTQSGTGERPIGLRAEHLLQATFSGTTFELKGDHDVGR